MKFEIIGLTSHNVYDTIEANSRKEFKEKAAESVKRIYENPDIRENLIGRYCINNNRESIVKKFDKILITLLMLLLDLLFMIFKKLN